MAFFIFTSRLWCFLKFEKMSVSSVTPPYVVEATSRSVCMKLKHAAVSQRKVILTVAAEAVGGALHVFTSNSPLKLTDLRGWKEIKNQITAGSQEERQPFCGQNRRKIIHLKLKLTFSVYILLQPDASFHFFMVETCCETDWDLSHCGNGPFCSAPK